MAASLAFYQLLGLDVHANASEHFSRIVTPGGMIEIGSYALTRGYDPGFAERGPGPSATCLQFHFESREAIDDVFARVTAAGHRGTLAPIDAFWGSRYAEVLDPDGNTVGFQSPRDPDRGGPPPV
jgi:uncharacterized glyoxalase superfamily protein PhnB